MLFTSHAARQSVASQSAAQHPISGLTFLNPTSIPRPTSTATPIVQQPLPTNHFAFGVDNVPGAVQYLNDMRATNGAAFDYRYQYLSAGVNTGHGWETWNSPAGAFATYYIQ